MRLKQDLLLCLDRAAFARHLGSRLHRRRIDPDPWQEQVLASDAKQKILNTSRQVGKSTVISALSLHKAMYDPGSLTLLFAPTEKQVKELFAKVARYYIASGGQLTKNSYSAMRNEAASVRKIGIELKNGSRIEAMPATEHSSRGFTADLLVIDEAAYAKDIFYDSILPSLAVSGGDLVLASTPNGQRGFFYREWTEGEGWDRFEVPYTECPRIDPVFVERERRRRGDRHVRQEYECSFEETEDLVFSRGLVRRARERGKHIEPLLSDEIEDLDLTEQDPVF